MKWQNSGKIVAKFRGWLGGRVNGRTSVIRTRDPYHVKFAPQQVYLIDLIQKHPLFNAHLASLDAPNENKDLQANSGKGFYLFLRGLLCALKTAKTL